MHEETNQTMEAITRHVVLFSNRPAFPIVSKGLLVGSPDKKYLFYPKYDTPIFYAYDNDSVSTYLEKKGFHGSPAVIVEVSAVAPGDDYADCEINQIITPGTPFERVQSVPVTEDLICQVSLVQG